MSSKEALDSEGLVGRDGVCVGGGSGGLRRRKGGCSAHGCGRRGGGRRVVGSVRTVTDGSTDRDGAGYYFGRVWARHRPVCPDGVVGRRENAASVVWDAGAAGGTEGERSSSAADAGERNEKGGVWPAVVGRRKESEGWYVEGRTRKAEAG